MSTRTTQRSRLIAGLLLLTGCGSSADKNDEATNGDGAAGQVAAGSGGSAGSAGSSGPAAGSGDHAGSGDQAGSGEHDAGSGDQTGSGEHDAGSGDQAGGAEEDAGSGDQAGSDEDDAGSGSMSGDVGPSWANDVHPALVGSCSGCHAMNGGGGPPRPGGPGEGGSNAPGKFAVDDAHAAYMAVAPLVVAGDPSTSSLYIKISEDMPSNGGQRMPPALRQWDDASIQLVHDWIAAGAKEN